MAVFINFSENLKLDQDVEISLEILSFLELHKTYIFIFTHYDTDPKTKSCRNMDIYEATRSRMNSILIIVQLIPLRPI